MVIIITMQHNDKKYIIIYNKIIVKPKYEYKIINPI